MKIAVVAVWAAILTLTGCSKSSVTIVNKSGVTLPNIVVVTSGSINRIGLMVSGASEQMAANAKGESGLRISFEAGSRKIDAIKAILRRADTTRCGDRY